MRSRALCGLVVTALAVPARAQGPTSVVLDRSERWIGDRGEAVTRRDPFRVVSVHARSAGGWQTIRSNPSQAWLLTIDGVPAGPIIVSDDVDHVASPARRFDLTFTHLGRPDLKRVHASAPITVNLTGLHPWQGGDRVVFFAPDARSYESNVQRKLNAAPAPGATRLVASGDYGSFLGANLVDGPGHGDEAWFLDMASATSPEGVRYIATRKVLQTRKLKIDRGQPVSVAGKMTDVRQTQKATMDWQIGESAALVRAVSPQARATGGVWQLVALPGGDRHGGHDFGGTLVYVPIEPLRAPPRARLTYGDPFPKGWGRVGGARLTYQVDVPVLGAREPYPLEVTLTVGDSAAAFAGPVKPIVTPVRAPKINGRDAFTPQAHVTVNPEVSWTPPAVGQPSLYELQVYRTRMNRERKADLQLVARLFTADTRLSFPPGVIVPAEVYVLVIQASWGEGLDAEHPFHESVRRATAPCVTALFSP